MPVDQSRTNAPLTDAEIAELRNLCASQNIYVPAQLAALVRALDELVALRAEMKRLKGELGAILNPPSGYCQECGLHPIDATHFERHRQIAQLRESLAAERERCARAVEMADGVPLDRLCGIREATLHGEARRAFAAAIRALPPAKGE